VNNQLTLYILHYPNALPSALYGISDLFTIANQHTTEYQFDVKPLPHKVDINNEDATVVFIPPCLNFQQVQFSDPDLLARINNCANAGAIMVAACAGVFLLANAGLLDGKHATSHWQLCQQLHDNFPAIKKVTSFDMVVDQGDIITAAGLYAFQDLALHIIARFAGVSLAKKVADFCLLDFNSRLQAYYQRFYPDMSHGDPQILKAQQFCTKHIYSNISVLQLAKHCNLSQRTLLRRFKKVTRYSPKQYIIQLKVEQAKQLMELEKMNVEKIAYKLGYDDVSNFIKIFKKVAGITPAEFKARQ